MAISNPSVTDYTGRLKDISILQSPDATIIDSQTVTPSFGKVTKFCAGVQKLLQKYTVILFTNLGSQENFPDFGTDFLYTLKAGVSPIDSLAVAQIFNMASYEAVNTLKAYQASTDTIPLDERIASASLTNITLYGGYVAFDVTIVTDAGDSIDFVVPLPK